MSVERPPGSLTAGGDARELHLAESDVPAENAPVPELPDLYGENRLIFLVRDPTTLFAAWEVAPETLQAVKELVHQTIQTEAARLTLRVFTFDNERGDVKAVDDFDVEGAHSWYVSHPHGGPRCRAQLGVKAQGHFHVIVESAPIGIPPGRESSVVDAEWTTIEEVLERSRQGHYKASSPWF